MSDLDAAIRARLEERPCFATHELYGDRARDANGWISHAKAAIVAVLDRHKPAEGWNAGKVVCTCQPDNETDYPCPMVRVIAENLGVEVDDGRASV